MTNNAQTTTGQTTTGPLYATHRFLVEVQGITEGVFIECSGLEAEIEIFDWQEGGWNGQVHRFPGRAKTAPNLVLKRGIATDTLWQWYRQVTQGQIQRKNLSIIVYGYDENPQLRWNFTGALPVKWTGPTFKADAAEVAVESLELIHQGFERASQ